jgi:hypothetical protein
MPHVKRSLFSVSLILILFASSCALRKNTTGTIPQSALQWTIIYNAALAKTNRAVEQAVETVQVSGALTVAQTRPILIGCQKVALTSEAVRGITTSGTEASWSVDGPKIRAVLAAAQLTLPASSNQTIDLAVSAANAAITLLVQGVK